MAKRKSKKVSRTRRRWEDPARGDDAKIKNAARIAPRGRKSVKISNETHAIVAELARGMNNLNLKAITQMPGLKAGYYSMDDVIQQACQRELEELRLNSK